MTATGRRSAILTKALLATVVLAPVGWWVGDRFHDARIEARRQRMLQDAREVFAAQSRYALLDHGRFGTWECLAEPWPCLPSYPKGAPPLLVAGSNALSPASGYRRELRLSRERDGFDYWAIAGGGVAICADEDYFRHHRLEDSREPRVDCDALRGSFEGVQVEAKSRREERQRLLAEYGQR